MVLSKPLNSYVMKPTKPWSREICVSRKGLTDSTPGSRTYLKTFALDILGSEYMTECYYSKAWRNVSELFLYLVSLSYA